MGDMADWEIETSDFDWDDWDTDDSESRTVPRKIVAPNRNKPQGKPMPRHSNQIGRDVVRVLSDKKILADYIGTLDDGSFDEDGPFQDVLHFLIPSIIKDGSEFLIQILARRARKRANQILSEGNPASFDTEFENLLNEFGLELRLKDES